MRLFHALALPAGAGLLLVAFEETAITWGAAGALLAGGRAFGVRHEPVTLRSAIWRVRCCWRPGRRLQCWQLGHRSPTRFK